MLATLPPLDGHLIIRDTSRTYTLGQTPQPLSCYAPVLSSLYDHVYSSHVSVSILNWWDGQKIIKTYIIESKLCFSIYQCHTVRSLTPFPLLSCIVTLIEFI